MDYAGFIQAVNDELGDAADLVRDENIARWINRGRARLGLYEPKAAALSWADGATAVDFPADFASFIRLVPDSGTTLIGYALLARSLRFVRPDSVVAGSAVLYYGATYPDVSGSAASTMPPLADEAAVSYALSRFYRRIAANRSDFRRYAAVTGQNGVDVSDLTALADEHLREYEDARSELIETAPATFYSD